MANFGWAPKNFGSRTAYGWSPPPQFWVTDRLWMEALIAASRADLSQPSPPLWTYSLSRRQSRLSEAAAHDLPIRIKFAMGDPPAEFRFEAVQPLAVLPAEMREVVEQSLPFECATFVSSRLRVLASCAARC